MNSTAEVISTEAFSEQRWQRVFNKQREASRNNGEISYQTRLEHLAKIEKILVDNQMELAAAISKDFGNRPQQETRMLDLVSLTGNISYIRKNLKKWMKPQKRHVGLSYIGSKNKILPQAKGVVGVISPWNYPLFLALSPTIGALAAGNRCMVKMAANSSTLCQLLDKLISEVFDEQYLAILPGVSASDFTSLPYDHLVFTGSAEVGKIVMATAAKHLTPVTLELGGKSPSIIAEDFDLTLAAKRLLFTKFVNAGQTCVAPDYLFVPRNKVDEFIALAREIMPTRYDSAQSKDYTSIIDDRAFSRLDHTLQKAIEQGANAINLLGDDKLDPQNRKFPPHIVTNVTDDMTIMQDEIFGPMLPIMPYDNLDDVINYINAKERPLALYLFSNDETVKEKVLSNTLSGGVTINDCLFHAAQHDMPFGGIGNSGMGQYHGKEGFLEFSKMRPVFTQSKFSVGLALAPPYGATFEKMISAVIKFKL